MISRKPKRLARSQIPTKPVEMPAGIESLDVQVSVFVRTDHIISLHVHCTMPVLLVTLSVVHHKLEHYIALTVALLSLCTHQFGELGIDFVGLESPPEQASEGAISLHNASPSIPDPEPKTSTDTAVPGLIPYSELQQRYTVGKM